jgi:D-alanyl-D-alanine carboxypeptidase
MTVIRGIAHGGATSAVAVALVAALGATAAPAVAGDVEVSRDGYPNHSSPTIAADPLDPSQLLAVSALVPAGPPTVVGSFASADGGRSWHVNGTLPLPGADNFASDVDVTFDARGTGFVSAATARFTSRGSGNVRNVYVWRALPGDQHFARPVLVGRSVLLDHPWIAANGDPSDPVLYVVWDAADGLLLSRSTDEGRTFSAPQKISPRPGEAPAVCAGTTGQVYVTYEPHTASGLTHALFRSLNYGQRFTYEGSLGPVPELLAPSPAVRLPSGPTLACYGSAATLAYAAPRPGSPSPTIYTARAGSSGGLTRPTSLSVPLTAAAFQPAIAVQADGTVDLAYYALSGGHVQVLLARSRDGARWGPSTPISPPFDPSHGLKVAFGSGPGVNKQTAPAFWWIGDWQGLTVAGNTLHAIWADTRTGNLQVFTAGLPLTPAASASRRNNIRARASLGTPAVRLRALLQRYLASSGAPGAVATLQTTQGTVSASAGVADLRTHAPMRTDDRFEIASVTKTFVATLMLQLVQARLLALDTPVSQLMPGLLPYSQPITVRELLNFTSGIPDYMSDPQFQRAIAAQPDALLGPRELVALVIRHPLAFTPGTRFEYSNTNYLILGLLIEKVTGQSLASELASRIFRPYHLSHTALAANERIPPLAMHGYTPDGGRMLDATSQTLGGLKADGGIVSTTGDVARFLSDLLSGRILAHQWLAQMETIPHFSYYGLGLIKDLPWNCANASWGFGGDLPGYLTQAYTTADGRTTAVFATNEQGPDRVFGTFKTAASASFCSNSF